MLKPASNKTESNLYRIWASMIQRCRNPKVDGYKQYGGRGISVCERWLRFDNFADDMGDRPKNSTLDRIENDGNYEPRNCRWATKLEQQRNRRDNVRISFNGSTLTLYEWAERTGICFDALRGRIRRGWPVEKALTAPSSKSNSVFRKSRSYKRGDDGKFRKDLEHA